MVRARRLTTLEIGSLIWIAIFFTLLVVSPILASYLKSQSYTWKSVSDGANTYQSVGNTPNSYLTVGTSPTISTLYPTNITATHAILQGVISSLQGASIANVQFNWGYTPALGNIVGISTSGLGTYVFNLNGISSATTIYYRLEAATDGAYYGNIIQFDTVSSLPTTTSSISVIVVIISILLVLLTLVLAIAGGINPIVAMLIAFIVGLIGIFGGAILQSLINSIS